MSRWIGTDFDGTLASLDGTLEVPGEPIPLMVSRVKTWLARGVDVRIVTARVGVSGERNDDGVLDDAAFADGQRIIIEAWCLKHIGQSLPIRASKDMGMIALYDDRAVQVEPNTGRRIDGKE